MSDKTLLAEITATKTAIFGISWLTPEIFISICAAIIAFASFWLAWWQTRETRKHNKLTVTPHLTSKYEIYYNEGHIKAHVQNNGFGPAIINKFDIYLDDNLVTGNDLQGPLELAYNSAFPGLINRRCKWRSLNTDLGEASIAANESVELFEILCDIGHRIPVGARWDEARSRVKIDIGFESVYHERNNLIIGGGR